MTVDSAALAIDGGTPAMPAGDPPPEWPVYDGTEEKALLEVLTSRKWGSTHGDVVATFEREFADYQQAAHGTCLTNGTLAITVALRAAGVGIGDEVIVPPYTFIATAAAALFVGAVPVFADVDPGTHLLDPDATEAAVTERTKAVVPVHLAGRPAAMDAFAELGRRHGLTIIEDAAQAPGAAYQGRPVGALGDLGTFSFQTSKNMTAGEGGAVLTDDEELAAKVYSLVNVGRVRGGGWYQHESVGYNLRLTEFQAAVLRAQLARHPQLQEIRERNAALLTSLLEDVEGVQPAPDDPAVTAHGRHLFLLRIPALAAPGRRDAALRALAAEGLTEVSSGYVPLHRNAALIAESKAIADRLGQPYPEAECPNADIVSQDTIWLTQRTLLGSEQWIRGVAAAITKVARSADTLAGTE
ncbi:dTDP-4-amino-4,6-dideoxygalactose transaminase [Kribbella amoyensis]|uniref:dTDP-4-amino-4,6-dideoxygalactose transaminase n=1 Tax=Kribbella amoyensis TaxID=996641 RepID=A0A561C0F2_9ACTN|nr:DegT/DnrJ/EryC1/StrS family aminotransferase [Kribbella amoyensis]TWD84669.1 dTDP-4-amino-4,6-dideoxygalactose transaminase [Kribbella amoyensis]